MLYGSEPEANGVRQFVVIALAIHIDKSLKRLLSTSAKLIGHLEQARRLFYAGWEK